MKILTCKISLTGFDISHRLFSNFFFLFFLLGWDGVDIFSVIGITIHTLQSFVRNEGWDSMQ